MEENSWFRPNESVLLYISKYPLKTTISVAAFDLDYTIVRSYKSVFPISSDDFKILPERKKILEHYESKGYFIVIFSNQYSTRDYKQLISLNRSVYIIKELPIKPWIFLSTEKDLYHKPNVGMWNLLDDILGEKGVSIDKKKSFFVGDAAGRDGDFADSDKLFAKNIGIQFYTPEEIFPYQELNLNLEKQNLVIFVGAPGSGKNSFYEKYLKELDFIQIDSDYVKNKEKQFKLLDEYLSEDKNVAVLATNPTYKKRKEFISIGNKYNVDITILYMVRNGYSWNKLRENPVPDIAYHKYFKDLEEPSFSLDKVNVVEIDRV